MGLYLKVPNKKELFYKQNWLKNSKTMSYNAGYNPNLKGYDKKTGTILKIDDDMIEWFEQ